MGRLGGVLGGVIAAACSQLKRWRYFVHNSMTSHWIVYFSVVYVGACVVMVDQTAAGSGASVRPTEVMPPCSILH